MEPKGNDMAVEELVEAGRIMAQAMLASFQERIAASAGMPYEQTKITTPNIGVYESYAAAASEALIENGFTVARLSRSTSTEAVAVKALEWTPGDGETASTEYYEARALGFVYSVCESQWSIRYNGDCKDIDREQFCSSDDEAKAAAQADFERRIRSTLAFPSLQGGAEPGDEILAQRYPEVLAAHAQFGGDLKDMLHRYGEDAAFIAADGRRTKPTIDELQAILNKDDGASVRINPDGTVTVTHIDWQGRAEKAEAAAAAKDAALKFYAANWSFKTTDTDGDREYFPTIALLDDAGNIARSTLAFPSLQGGAEPGAGRYRLVPIAALEWLNGEAPDPAGLWFGDFPDDHPKPVGAFWWRKQFADIISYYERTHSLGETYPETASQIEADHGTASSGDRTPRGRSDQGGGRPSISAIGETGGTEPADSPADAVSEAEVEALLAALEPFARAEEFCADPQRMPDSSSSVYLGAIGLNLGHIRAARAALEAAQRARK